MKIPKYIDIAGKRVEIVIDHKHCIENKYYGCSLYDKNIIILDDYKKSGFAKDKIKQTLIHEVIHYINAVLNLDDSSNDNETYVNPLSELLFQVIQQVEE